MLKVKLKAIQMLGKNKMKSTEALLTRHVNLEIMGRPGSANNFSTPPVSFQCINFLVGGAKSKVVIMSAVSANCSFIVSLGIPFCSSTISLRLRLPFLSCPTKNKY